MANKIAVENINHPGKTQNLDADKYEAVKAAYLRVLPSKTPGLTIAQAEARLKPLLPADLFPGGEKAGWWSKAVQLDLEAKRLIVREKGSPVRLHRV